MSRALLCPLCKRAVERSVESFPFCSDRCRLIDLGNWSDGSYAVAGEAVIVDDRESDEKLH